MRIASTAKSAAIVACLFVAGCAENKPAPEAQATTTGGVEAGTPQDFLLNVGDRVFFNENSAELSPTATSALDKQAVWLARYTTYVVNVEGHADEKGGAAKNKKLSVQRADAVQKYLVAKGVDPARIHVYSYGREKRVANCNDISCWSQNRRVVTVLQTAADPLMKHQAVRPQARAQPQRQPEAAAQTQMQAQQRMPVYFSPPAASGSAEPNTFDAAAQSTQ